MVYEIALLALLTLVASGIGTLTGFGTSTIMIPVLVLFLPPIEAIFLVAIIHWFGDIWKVILFRQGLNFKLIALFGLTGLIASYVGASLSLGTHEATFLRLLGALLAGYAIFTMFQKKFRFPANNGTALVGGALSGFFAGLFGIGGPLRSMFLLAFNLPKAVYLATAGAIGLMVDVTRVATYVASGATLPHWLWWSLLVLVPVSFLGAKTAHRIVNHVPQRQFRALVAVFLGVVALKLLIWP